MLILNGKNLGERHKDLNTKVYEAAQTNVDFEEVKSNPEHSDVDKLFKIDLASKYKNIEFIVEVLKSGDALHISRALKCEWMFNDQFSDYINVEYLQQNVFPFMSIKMKKKLLTTISINVRNAERAKTFFNYCINTKLTGIALKFLIFTSDDFKIDCLKNSKIRIKLNRNYANNFIGGSFILADAHLESLQWFADRLQLLIKISYLYSVSETKYLNLLEKYVDLKDYRSYNMIKLPRFGLRISKDIMTKHKDRVILKPLLYINVLNKMSIVKYSTIENVKMYATALLRPKVTEFWEDDYCRHFEHILNVLPTEERFVYIKQIFNDKYPDQPFEMNLKFYSLKYYRFMTAEQKNQWALNQIASQEEILGIGNDYIWYKFVNFEKAFVELKKWVMNTTDSDKRSKIVNILIDLANINILSKSQRDLEKIFKYYYDRHNNEQRYYKERFVDLVTHNCNVYEFDENCWDAFNKIYQNLDVYSMSDSDKGRTDYKLTAFIYHVVNEIDVHEALILFISTNMYFYSLKNHLKKLTEKKQDLLYQYLFKFYLDKIKELDSAPYEEVKEKLRKYITYFCDLLREFNKTKSDIPPVVTKLIQLDGAKIINHPFFYEPRKRITEADMFRLLKKDAKLVVESLPLVKERIHHDFRCRLSQILKKIKVYFCNDISKEYINFFNEFLTENDKERIWLREAQAVCYGIFQLAEDSLKVNFMTKYAPTQSKINRSEIDDTLLSIQQAICSTAFYSRPPVPLSNMLMYLKGDYVPSCLPMFNYYLVNLPRPLCMQFIEAILNKPVSIQKHGLRLAFTSFTTEDLRKLILNVWNRTNNVSIRFIIYKYLFNKIITEKADAQLALFDTLTILTLKLREEDNIEIFTLWQSRTFPTHLLSDYINSMWTVLNTLKDSKINRTRKNDIIKHMASNIGSVRQDVVRSIAEEFVKGVFNTEDSIKASLKPTDSNKLMWDLTAGYIMYVPNKNDLEVNLELMKHILTQCANRFNTVDDNKYIMRQFLLDFSSKFYDLSVVELYELYETKNVVLEKLLQILQDLFAVENIYSIIWGVRINIEIRKTAVKMITQLPIDNEVEKRAVVRNSFLNFGKEFGNMINEFIEKGIYFRMFHVNIIYKLINNIKTSVYMVRKFAVESEDILILVAAALMEFKSDEMYMFALNILPTSYKEGYYIEDYKKVLNDLKGLNNLEIKCKMYDKFVNSDFEPRAFLEL